MNAVAEEAVQAPEGPVGRIVAQLLKYGRLKEADLASARRLQEQDGGDLLVLLARLGLVSERDHAVACSSEFGLELRNTKDLPDLPPEDVALSVKFMKQYHVVPVAADAQGVDVLLADPQDPYVLGAVAPP